MTTRSTNWKSIGLWGGFILVLVGLLIGLAQLGTKTMTTTSGSLVVEVQPEDQVKGKADAPNTLVEYSDFQCPACAQYQPMIKRFMAEAGDNVRFVYRHYPLITIHPNAKSAAIAAEAAGKQGKFWEMHDALFNTQDTWSSDRNPEFLFEDYAKSLGLDVTAFKADMKSDATKDKVERDMRSGDRSGVQSTPTFYWNGTLIQPQSYDDFKKLIQNS